jgi:hypothetical protein
LCDVGNETQRSRHRQASKPNICDIRFGTEINAQKHMAPRTDRAVRDIPKYSGREACDPEAEFPQNVAEEQVVLEAVASASTVDEFVLEGGQIEFDRLPAQRTEVLEGNRLRVVKMERAQGL